MVMFWHAKLPIRTLLLLLLLLLLISQSKSSSSSSPELVYSFPLIDYWFRSEQERTNYHDNGIFKSAAIAGIKIGENDDIFVSLPRWKSAKLPGTLAKVVKNNTQVRLEPFPSWEWNDITSNTSEPLRTLYSVLGFEIDHTKKRMWILDQGRVEETVPVAGAIKLVCWDLLNNRLDFVYPFPNEVASVTQSFLNDLVVDSSRNLIYITDSGIPVNNTLYPYKPGLIIFDVEKRTSRRVLDSAHSTNYDPTLWIIVNRKNCLSTAPMRTGADGIALSCDFSRLYWTPLTSRSLFTVDVDALVADSPSNPIVTELKGRDGASDGLICSNKGIIYFSDIENSAILAANEGDLRGRPSLSDIKQQISTVAKDSRMVWPDTFSLSDKGYLYFTTNNLCDFVQGNVNFSSTTGNFYIWRLFVDSLPYVYGCEKPKLDGLAVFLILFAVLAFVGVIVAASLFCGLSVYQFFHMKKREVPADKQGEDEPFAEIIDDSD